jgi:hypothetical protein
MQHSDAQLDEAYACLVPLALTAWSAQLTFVVVRT